MSDYTLRMALPKGRLLDNVLKLLSEIGLTFEFKNDRDYIPVTNDKEIVAKVVKVRAIPQLLALGQFNVGFAGLDLLKEAGYDEIKPVLDLGLNPVKLVVAVHESQKDLLLNPPNRPVLIATEYENIAHNWAIKNNMAHIIIQTWGSTEAFAPDDADLVFDNVDSGRTMKANNLIIIDEIMDSSTYLVVNAEAYMNKEVKRKVDELVQKIKENKK